VVMIINLNLRQRQRPEELDLQMCRQLEVFALSVHRTVHTQFQHFSTSCTAVFVWLGGRVVSHVCASELSRT